VNAQTVNYTAVAADSGKLITMNGSSLTLTLPNPPPSATWTIAIANLNNSTLTISRNTLNINGLALNSTIQATGTSLGVATVGTAFILTDGSNYFLLPGFPGSARVSFVSSATGTTDTLTVGLVGFAQGIVSMIGTGSTVEYISGNATGFLTGKNNNAGNFHPIPITEFGSCAMSAATTCTFSALQSFSGTPLCFVSVSGAPGATAFMASCAISSTTVTITANATNSLTWNAILVGNPN
jgi:hypothetical protein